MLPTTKPKKLYGKICFSNSCKTVVAIICTILHTKREIYKFVFHQCTNWQYINWFCKCARYPNQVVLLNGFIPMCHRNVKFIFVLTHLIVIRSSQIDVNYYNNYRSQTGLYNEEETLHTFSLNVVWYAGGSMNSVLEIIFFHTSASIVVKQG